MTRPQRRSIAVLILALPLSVGVWGCASDDEKQAAPADKPVVAPKAEDAGSRQLKPSDFAVDAPPVKTGDASPQRGAAKITPAAPAAEATPAAADVDPTKPVITVTPLPEGAADATYTMDAMVGQVNGNAIYASTVFDPLSEQLAALGRSQPRSVFRTRAAELITKRLDEIVADALILGEAERDLSEQEQAGLQNMMRDHQEELLRQYGTGSRSLADENAVRKTGRTISQLLEEFRQRVIVQRYMREKLLPKINVTRKDIERYYNDNLDTFNPLPGRKLRVMKATEANAAKIEEALAAGKPFAEIAAGSLNNYRPSTGGMWPDTVISEKVFGDEGVNSAMLKLKVGEYTRKIKVGEQYWFVYLESREEGKARPLREAQVEIEELLRRQRFNELSKKYREKLFAKGSYNPLQQMTEGLVSVAMSRYALSE